MSCCRLLLARLARGLHSRGCKVAVCQNRAATELLQRRDSWQALSCLGLEAGPVVFGVGGEQWDSRGAGVAEPELWAAGLSEAGVSLGAAKPDRPPVAEAIRFFGQDQDNDKSVLQHQ